MTYCTSCGSELTEDVKFCPECGTEQAPKEIDASQEDDGLIEEGEVPSDEGGFSIKMALAAGVMGVIIGFFALWGTINWGSLSGAVFLIAFLGSSYFLYHKRIPSEAIGSGLYITALVMILTPLVFYLTSLTTNQQGGIAGAGVMLGSILGLVIWGFVFLLFAIVAAGVGYFFKRRAYKKLGD